MANEIFVDTSGFYAMLVKRDDQHAKAGRILADSGKKRRGFITTDYVLDETATLMKARGHSHLIKAFFDIVFASKACRTEWIDVETFEQTRAFFVKHDAQEWSFTDCTSFCVMKRCQLREAMTKDHHFDEAGFVALLT